MAARLGYRKLKWNLKTFAGFIHSETEVPRGRNNSREETEGRNRGPPCERSQTEREEEEEEVRCASVEERKKEESALLPFFLSFFASLAPKGRHSVLSGQGEKEPESQRIRRKPPLKALLFFFFFHASSDQSSRGVKTNERGNRIEEIKTVQLAGIRRRRRRRRHLDRRPSKGEATSIETG